jgi:hypothetical protein
MVKCISQCNNNYAMRFAAVTVMLIMAMYL